MNVHCRVTKAYINIFLSCNCLDEFTWNFDIAFMYKLIHQLECHKDMKQKYCIFATNTIFMLTNAISNVSHDNFIAINYHVNANKEKI